jgi:pimeloyl-ACP methyl ester carboxylesterase
MAVEVVLPRVDMAMEKGSIQAWKVMEGQAVKEGDLLFELETDKSTMEVEASASGIIAGISVAENVEVPVGTVVARIYAEGEAIPEKGAEEAAKPAEPLVPKAAAEPAPVPAGNGFERQVERQETVDLGIVSSKVRATPLARRIASQQGLDLSRINGTGPNGRVQSGDIRSAAGNGHAPAATGAVRPEFPSVLPSPAIAKPPVGDGPGGKALRLPQGNLSYREWTGSGEAMRTVVLVHGFSGDAQTWFGLAKWLSAGGLRVLAPDLPGHGQTTIDAHGIDDIVNPLVRFLDEVTDGPVELVGHSMGAVAAVRAALQAERKVSRLTLLAPAGLGSEIDVDFIQGMATAKTAGGVAHLLRRLTVRPVLFTDAQLEALVSATGASGRLLRLAETLCGEGRQRVDIVRDLDRLRIPVRVVFGLEDRIVPWQQVTALPHRAAIHLVSGAGHMPHWDQPEAVAALL